MKTVFTVIALIFFNSILLGQTKSYKNDLNKYAFEYFDDWELKEHANRVTVFAPSEGMFDNQGENLGISVSPIYGMTLETCYKRYIADDFPRNFKDYKKIEEGEVVLNGTKSKWIECKFTLDGMLVTNLIYTIVKNNKLYILIAYSSTKKYPMYKDKFVKIIETFKIK